MKKLCYCLIVFVLSICFIGCREEGIPKEKVFLTDSEYAELYTAPLKFKGKYAEVAGEIIANPEVKDDQITIQIGSDSDHEKRMIIIKEGIHQEFKTGDYIKAIGYIDGEIKNSNISDIQMIPCMKAEIIEEVDYITALSPSLKTIEPNIAKEQHGITMTITKVEFASTETRVYLRIENNSSNKVYFYSFYTKIIQSGKQYEEQINYKADYNEVNSEILPGITSKGIVVFPVLDQTNLTIHANAHSDDYAQHFEDYIFEITVP